MEEFQIEGGVLLRYEGGASEVTVPDGVTEIGEYAFLGCQSLQSIQIPASVMKIGMRAFCYCRSLQRIRLPMYLRVIERLAFSHCSGLKEIRLPEHTREIGEYAFQDCTELAEVRLPEGLQKIGRRAFENCEKLQSIRLPQHLREIGLGAFENCTNLEQILCAADDPRYRVENGLLLDTERKALLWCSPKRTGSCTVPDGVEQIGPEAFFGCTGLEEILLPEGVQWIRGGAFYGCQNLRRLSLPESVTEIGEVIVDDCPHLESINLPEGLRNVAHGAFLQCGDLRLRMPGKPGAGMQEILRSSKVQILIVPQLPCAFLEKEEHRHAALLGFVLTREEELPYIDEAAWREYGRSEKTWLLGKRETDLGVLRWLLREKLLTREEAEDLLPEADTLTRLLLLNYIHETFPAGDGTE